MPPEPAGQGRGRSRRSPSRRGRWQAGRAFGTSGDEVSSRAPSVSGPPRLLRTASELNAGWPGGPSGPDLGGSGHELLELVRPGGSRTQPNRVVSPPVAVARSRPEQPVTL